MYRAKAQYRGQEILPRLLSRHKIHHAGDACFELGVFMRAEVIEESLCHASQPNLREREQKRMCKGRFMSPL